MGIFFQLVGTTLLCCSCINMGVMMAWPSSTILLFKSSNTTLHRPMGDAEVSLFGSLPAIGSLIANPIAGVVLDRMGRKKTVMLTSMMFVLAWSIIAMTSQVEVVLTAMFVGGLGFAIFLETTIYISEISQDSIRGTMTAGPMQFYGFGILVSYFLGGYLTYIHMVYACLTMAVVGVLLLAVLKESPLTLMANGREEDAAKSIAFYRSKKTISKEVVQELDKLRRIFSSNTEDVQSLTAIEERLGPTLEAKKMTWWQFFKNSPSTQREFFVIMILKVAFVFQGLPVVQVYAEPLFAEAVPSDVISPNLCSLLMGVVVIIAGSIAAYLTDVVGRRPLLIYSSIAAGFCCIVLGTQILTEWGPKWTIPMFIYIFTAFYTFGAGTVPVVVLAEVFLPEVKSIMSMLAVEWAWILNFLILFVFNLLVTSVGLPPVFYFFSFVCFSTAVFFFFFLPETKGLPVYAIQELFTKK
ncbi:facilitated trehalose transporter Tret1-like [Helicoverpa zea]|uniref:facilitated trehalose transporter Tret1-like n=1 Tax=Helicoverpa zea TaxID=7113 RepID=UPI001F59D93D|nr:facilitated trehalose transporter Tret1-like [Helicoverpa zea]